MTDEYYFDTSIWIDFYEKRGRNGEAALQLILKVIEEDSKIAYSDLHIREFKRLGYTQEGINLIFNIVKPHNIKHVHIWRTQIDEAKNIARQRNLPKKDALHAILARDNELQLMARDYHFEKLRDITIANKPEDFI